MIYPFYCENCKKFFEERLTVAAYMAKSIHVCPNCKSYETRRIYTLKDVATIYKDEGFTKFIRGEE